VRDYVVGRLGGEEGEEGEVGGGGWGGEGGGGGEVGGLGGYGRFWWWVEWVGCGWWWVVVERQARRGRRIEGGREVGVLVVCRMQRDTARVIILVGGNWWLFMLDFRF